MVQIQNNFTDLFLMMPSTKIAQTVSLGLIQGRLTEVYNFGIYLNFTVTMVTKMIHKVGLK